jgi:aspartyl protease family protein
MGRLIGLIVFFAVAAMTVPAFFTNNPEIVEQGVKAETKPQEPAQELTAKRVSLSGEERIDMNAQGHFIAQFRMNGRQVEAMVDTGATMVAINRSTARRLGINVVPADFKYSVSTANGQTKVARAVIQSIEIGGVRVRDVEAAVLDDRALGGTLLGMSFLKQLKSFGVENNELILKQ